MPLWHSEQLPTHPSGVASAVIRSEFRKSEESGILSEVHLVTKINVQSISSDSFEVQ